MNKLDFVAIAITLTIALTVGVVLLGVMNSDLSMKDEQMTTRANEVYENYTYEPSGTGGDVMLGVPVPNNTQAYEPTTLVRNHLYVTGYAYTVGELSTVLHLKEETVREALHELQDRGIVESGYLAYMFIPQKHWIHTDYRSIPDKWYHPYATVLPTMGALLLLGVIISYIQTHRNSGENDE